jgi:hypothetical protein
MMRIMNFLLFIIILSIEEPGITKTIPSYGNRNTKLNEVEIGEKQCPAGICSYVFDRSQNDEDVCHQSLSK